MATTSQTQALEDWLRSNNGYLNQAVNVVYSPEQGCHWRTTTELEPRAPLCMVPHSLALSYLNALVDDVFPVFKQRRTEFKIENIGFFYLMAQYVNRDKSFWKPYLDLLPPPDSELLTPLWFDDPRDLAWLEGTDVLFTARGRLEVYREYHSSGVKILQQAGIDTTPYTWDLFRWAVTMFTSRSFSSRAIAPAESKYWTAYKSAADGRRQTVLMDMSHVPAADLDFSILFPVMDAGNHRHDARVLWSYDPGRFSICSETSHAPGDEVFNNYGSDKGNGELLMGYGFCIPNNPGDSVLVTLKSPEPALAEALRGVHPGYFSPDGQWDGTKATFHLKSLQISSMQPVDIFSQFPEPLLELLLYMLQHERGVGFEFIEHPYQYLTNASSPGRRYLPFIARGIVQSLATKFSKLQSMEALGEVQNKRQELASIYRAGQLDIIRSITSGLKTFTRSYLKTATEPGSRLVTLEGLLQLWAGREEVETVGHFLTGIEAATGTYDVVKLRAAGWEEDVLVLLLCAILLTAPDNGDHWIRHMQPTYIDSKLLHLGQTEAGSTAPEGASGGLMDVIRTAANAVPDSFWRDPRWGESFILGTGGKLIRFDSMMMMVPDGETQTEDARLVIYVHEDGTSR